MKNYNIKKHYFEEILINNPKKHLIKPEFENYGYESSYEDNKYLGLYYISISNTYTCKKCKCKIKRQKGYRVVYPLCALYNNKPIIIKFKKKIYYCKECKVCTVEGTPTTKKKKQINENYIHMIVENLKYTNSTYTETSNRYKISISTVIRKFDDLKSPIIDRSKLFAINVDETRFIKSAGNYQFVVIDSKTQDIIDILKDRTKLNVKKLYESYTGLELINQDLWKSYKEAAHELNPNIKIVADLFHVVRQGTWSFNRGRREYMKSKETKLKVGIGWRTLMYSKNKLDSKARGELNFLLSKHPQLAVLYQAKEMFFKMCKSKTKDEFIHLGKVITRYIDKYDLKDFKKAMKSIHNWRVEIVNAIECKTSNALSEQVNSMIKQSKRNARGFKNLGRSIKLLQYRQNTCYNVA